MIWNKDGRAIDREIIVNVHKYIYKRIQAMVLGQDNDFKMHAVDTGMRLILRLDKMVGPVARV
jgi:hypothetical protein